MTLNQPFTFLRLCLHLQILSGQCKSCNQSSSKRRACLKAGLYQRPTESILHTSLHPKAFSFWSSLVWTPWGDPEAIETKQLIFNHCSETSLNVLQIQKDGRMIFFWEIHELQTSFNKDSIRFLRTKENWTEFRKFQTLFYNECLCNFKRKEKLNYPITKIVHWETYKKIYIDPEFAIMQFKLLKWTRKLVKSTDQLHFHHDKIE